MNKKQDNLDYIEGYGRNYANLRKYEYNGIKDYTVRELANELHIAASTISLIEKEKRPPTIEQVKIYKNFFNVSLDYLTGNIKRTKTNIEDICIYTGLYRDTVEYLNESSEHDYYNDDVLKVFNDLICSGDIFDIALNLIEIKKYSKIERNEETINYIADKLGLSNLMLKFHIDNMPDIDLDLYCYKNIKIIEKINRDFCKPSDVSKLTENEIKQILEIK